MTRRDVLDLLAALGMLGLAFSLAAWRLPALALALAGQPGPSLGAVLLFCVLAELCYWLARGR